MVSVSNDETAQEAGTFAKQTKATFPVVHDPKNAVYEKFGISVAPTNILVDRKGKVVWSHEGVDIPKMNAAVAKTVAAK